MKFHKVLKYSSNEAISFFSDIFVLLKRQFIDIEPSESAKWNVIYLKIEFPNWKNTAVNFKY